MKTCIKMSNQSIIKYNPSIKKADFFKGKLKTNNPKLKGEEIHAVSAISGIELLLYVIKDFHIAVESL